MISTCQRISVDEIQSFDLSFLSSTRWALLSLFPFQDPSSFVLPKPQIASQQTPSTRPYLTNFIKLGLETKCINYSLVLMLATSVWMDQIRYLCQNVIYSFPKVVSARYIYIVLVKPAFCSVKPHSIKFSNYIYWFLHLVFSLWLLWCLLFIYLNDGNFWKLFWYKFYDY